MPEHLSPIRQADPHLQRELQRYAHPLPSREYIAAILAEKACPMSFEDLCALLDIVSEEREDFMRRIQAMQREGTLLQNRKHCYILPERADLIAGQISGHPDGYGFLLRDDKQPDLFLDQRQMSKVLHGDRVLARHTGVDRRGRQEGSIVEVLERANSSLIGRVKIEHGLILVIPENRKISQKVLIPPTRKKVDNGQIVVVELLEQPSLYSQPIGKISEILGTYTEEGMEIEIALRKNNLPFVFSKKAELESSKIEEVTELEAETRVDLRHLDFVTIDGETARDFDDAVYCAPYSASSSSSDSRMDGTNDQSANADDQAGKVAPAWRLVVAIADVSHYVRVNSALDHDAFERGNSVYFPRRVIPMLPEKLSNGVCSLNPDVPRLALVCDMQIDAAGNIVGYTFYPALFVSRARLTYTEVAAWLTGKKKPTRKLHKGLLPHLQNLHQLYQIFRLARAQRGAIDFETHETKMIFNDNGKIDKIVPDERNVAHQIIEESMLAANVCAAAFIQTHRHPCLFRVHQGPNPERLAGLRLFLAEFGLTLGGGDQPKAEHYAALVQATDERLDKSLIQTVLLRSLQQAVYSPDNKGHFGLAYEAYTHFTSPIRRYPDLLVHRTIKAILLGTSYVPGMSWEALGQHCSMTERRADEATRDVDTWLKCYYMQDHVGEIFEGNISSVNAFGVFVSLDPINIEGLIHVSDLGEDYFHYDKTKHRMLGERSKQQFRIGDRLSVQVVRADPERGRIDLIMSTPPKKSRRK